MDAMNKRAPALLKGETDMNTPWTKGTDYGSAQLSRALQDAGHRKIERNEPFVQYHKGVLHKNNMSLCGR